MTENFYTCITPPPPAVVRRGRAVRAVNTQRAGGTGAVVLSLEGAIKKQKWTPVDPPSPHANGSHTGDERY